MRADAVYLVTVGRLVRRKNLGSLLTALHRLGLPDVRLLVIGEGPERANLEAQARELGIAERVQFRGFVAEETKYQLLAAADLFVLPSLHEAFGLVYLEAMHCGLPVVATVPGGHEDFLSDGRTGFLVPRDDAGALLRAMERLAGNRGAAAGDERWQPRPWRRSSASPPPPPATRSCSSGSADRCPPEPAPRPSIAMPA